MAAHAPQKEHRFSTAVRRLVQTLAVVTAVALIPVAATAATPSAQGAGSTSSQLNVSPNPVLASGSAGFDVQEGGTRLKRVSVSDHVAASWAARVSTTATTTRIREPKVRVQSGTTLSFASDVKVATGRVQITVSWFRADGSFVSWTGGRAQEVESSRWTRVATALRVPAGAVSARTTVNVLGTAPSTTIEVTQHDVRAQVTDASAGTTAPTGTTTSPTPSTTAAPTTTGSASTPAPTATGSTSMPAPTATGSTSTRTPAAPTSQAPATSTTITNLPAQAAGLFYGPPSGARAYAQPGGLVIAGRDNYADQAFEEVSAGGGSVLIYLDAIIDNPYGRYHDMLINASACGPATARWPGNYTANSYGHLNDFRVGSVLQAKFRCVLETMVAENPHMAGWFADDLGSRSWFPGLNWSGFPDKAAYREGAIALTQTLRSVANEHGLIFLVNGTWSANDGGGYPNVGQSGNALADGGFVEHHEGEIGFFGPYGCSTQWAAQSPVTRGEAINYAVTNTAAGLREYAGSGCYAYVSQQTEYSGVAPWGSFHPTGLPSRVVY